MSAGVFWRFAVVLGAFFAVAGAPAARAQTSADTSPMVGGAPMYSTRTIVENASESRDHTTLVAAVRAAGLVDTLDGPGPFTVFAPTNEAFAKMPPGAVDALLRPENRPALVKLLTYHVVAGKLTAARLRAAVKVGKGTATLTTIEGEPLSVSLYDDHIVLTDAKGGTSTVTIDNVMQANGLIHVVDGVLAP